MGKTKKILVGLGLAVAGPLVWLGWGARPLDPVGEYGITTPAVPSPNAHDLYYASERAFRRSRDDGRVAQVLDFNADESVPEDAAKYPLAGKQKWIRERREGFALYDRALRTAYLFPPVREPKPNGNIDAPYHFRWLAKALTVECEVFAATGQHEQAVQRALDVWQLGIDSARGAPLEVALNSQAVERQARRAVDGEIALLTGAEAARGARRFEKMLATRVAFEQTLGAERDSMLFQFKPMLERQLDEARRQADVKRQIDSGADNIFIPSDEAPKRNGPHINWIVRRASDGFARGMDSLIADAATPWPSRATTPPRGHDEHGTELLATIQKGRFFTASADALSRLTWARMALHAFRKDKGFYPDALEKLVPAYATKLPTDPFAAGGGLHYRKDGARYKLWSVGPDGVDDGGKPIDKADARTARGRSMVRPDSAGDIVANVNR